MAVAEWGEPGTLRGGAVGPVGRVGETGGEWRLAGTRISCMERIWASYLESCSLYSVSCLLLLARLDSPAHRSQTGPGVYLACLTGEASELIFWTSLLVDLFDEASKLIFTSFSWLSLTREASVLILITSPQCFELFQAAGS